MIKFTESMLNGYSQPLSATEDSQCKHAITMVRDALKALSLTDDDKPIAPLYSDTLAYAIEMRSLYGYDSRKIKIFVQGSYANNTNVRTESDVDIAVVEEDVFRTEYRLGQTDFNYNFTKAPTRPKKFKDEVQEALTVKFGSDVERGDKSVKVHGNTYRKDADTVPSLRYRDYRNDFNNNTENFVGGILIYPDSGGQIINYPEQHIFNGRQKNSATNGYFKKMVRIMKKMRYLMEDVHISSASYVGSFILESLLWNVADGWYLDNCGQYRKVYAFYQLIQMLIASKNKFASLKEANGIKPLCADAATNSKLCKFIDDLAEFYEYE
jgi:hypothetical protein